MTKNKHYQRYCGKSLELDDVLEILGKTITEFQESEKLHYSYILACNGLYRSKLRYWADNHEEAKELIEVLRELADARQHEALIDGDGSTTGIIFSLKCNRGWMEEEKRQQLKSDEKDISDTKTIEIGYDED